MSGYAYQWAKRQRVGDSSAKTVLKAYAHWASEDYSTWVTNEEMMLDTELNIQTIRKARDKLIALGFLIETKKRLGETRSIVVYQMLAPEGSTVVQALDQRTGETISLSPPSREAYESKPLQKSSRSKSGASSKGSEKQSPSKSGSPSNLASSGSKSHVKRGEIPPQAPPNLDTKKGLGLQEVAGEGFTPGQTSETSHTPDDEQQTPEPPPSGFDRFWAAWPGSSGRKQAMVLCQAHWNAAGLEEHADAIVTHVEAMAKTPHWQTGGDPTPIRYLEQKRWLDGAPTPAPTPAPAARVEVAERWYETASGIDEQGDRKGVTKRPNENTRDYRVRVAAVCGRGPWIDHILREEKRGNPERYQQIVAFFSENDLLSAEHYA